MGAVGAGAGPGRGGISRGRGDAPMIWGDESPEHIAEFETTLVPRLTGDPGQSTMLGVGSAAPTVQANGEGGGLTAVEGSTGNQAVRRRLKPRHRRAVGTFFGGERD